MKIIKKNGLVVSVKKIKLFETKIRFLGHNIQEGSIIPIDRAIEFADKSLDEIKEKNPIAKIFRKS